MCQTPTMLFILALFIFYLYTNSTRTKYCVRIGGNVYFINKIQELRDALKNEEREEALKFLKSL